MTWTPEMALWSIGATTVLLGLLLMALDRALFGYRTPGWYIALVGAVVLVGALVLAFTPTPV